MKASVLRAIAMTLCTLVACRSHGQRTRVSAVHHTGGASQSDLWPTSVSDATAVRVADAAAELERAFPSQPPEVRTMASIRWPSIQRSTLANGVSIAFVEHHALPVLHVRVLLRGAGALFDPPSRPGLASITAALLREGITSMDSRAIAAAFDGAGARFETHVSDDAITLSLETLPERAEPMLSLVAKLIAEPTFPQDELDRLKRRELDRLAQAMAEPAWLSQRPFFRAVYGERHPYARFDTTPEVLRSVGREEVRRFHRTHILQGGSISIVAVGALTADAFAQLAERAFSAIPQGSVARPTMPAVPSRSTREIFIVDRPSSAQAYVLVGRVGPKRSDPSWPTLAVANQVIGAAPSSRLFVDLRERRSLTYGVYSRVTQTVDEGVVHAAGSTRLERAGEFTRALLEHLDRMSTEDVPEDELAHARRVVQNRLPVSFATAGDLAERISESLLYGLDQSYFERYPSQVAAVTSADVRAVSARFFATSTSVIVVVGPARTLRPMLEGLGPITVLRPGQ